MKACISGLFGGRFQNLRMPCAAAEPGIRRFWKRAPGQ